MNKDYEFFVNLVKNKDSYVILDTATTGLDNAEIIEIAIIDLNNNVLLDTLVKPVYKITDEAIEVHGIKDEDVANAPSWKEVYPKIEEILKDKIALIYNDEFDIQMLRNSCKYNDIEFKRVRSHCIMSRYTDFIDSEYFVSLEYAVGKEQDYRALSNCRLLLDLINKIVKK